MDSPRHSSLLHDVGRGHVVTPHVVLPLLQTDHTAQDVPSVDTDPHVHLHPRARPHASDSGDHGEPHPHHVHCVVWPGDREAGHTVVTVSQDLDPQTLVVTGQLVKLTETSGLDLQQFVALRDTKRGKQNDKTERFAFSFN